MPSLRDLPVQRGDGWRVLVRLKMLAWWVRGVGADQHAAVVLAKYPGAQATGSGSWCVTGDRQQSLSDFWATPWLAWAHARAKMEVGK